MSKSKLVDTPLASHFTLNSKECLKNGKEKKEMMKIPNFMICKRLIIAHVVGVVSKLLSNPRKEHWADTGYAGDIIWILRYLKETFRICLCHGNEKPKMVGYLDANYASDIDSRKSTSVNMITFGGRVVSWQSIARMCSIVYN